MKALYLRLLARVGSLLAAMGFCTGCSNSSSNPSSLPTTGEIRWKGAESGYQNISRHARESESQPSNRSQPSGGPLP
jgi:hypothetical protein